MSVETLIRAMPKVDINVQYEGAVNKDLVLLIAEQTDIARTYKKRKEFDEWVSLLKNPDFARIDEISHELYGWLRHPDDLARGVYELAVACSKQNMHYIEISVIPSLYNDAGLSFPDFLSAITDGADKAARAWKVRINWIFAIPREQPRKADETARWATGATAQKGNVVGLSLIGREDEQPIAQFKKAFAIAEKKDIARMTHVLSSDNAEDFATVVDVVNPTRLHNVWGLLDNGEALSYVIEHDIPVVVTPTREVRLGRINSVAEYPMRELLEHGVNVVISAGMAALYNTSLQDEYIALVNEAGLTLDEIETLALNGFRAALLPQDEKQAMIDDFRASMETLKSEHLAEETE